VQKQITVIPKILCAHKKVRKLRLSSNYLFHLRRSFFKLTTIRYLNLTHNYLSTLSPRVSKLTHLHKLHLSYNNLELLPDLSKIPLTLLYVNNNRLTSLPPLPPTIEGIDISGNRCTQLPENLRKTKILWLDIADNPIDEFPHWLYKLKKLIDLYLSDDQQRLCKNTHMKHKIRLIQEDTAP